MMVAPFVREGAPVRAVHLDGAPWFVAADLCRALGHSNMRRSVGNLGADERREARRGSVEVLKVTEADDHEGSETGKTAATRGGARRWVVVSESGMWALVLGSRLPSARRLRRWLTGEVLPALRQFGFHALPGAPAPAPAPAAKLTALARHPLGLGATAARGEARAEALEARGLRVAPGRLHAVERLASLKPAIGAVPALAQVAAEEGVAVATLEGWRARRGCWR